MIIVECQLQKENGKFILNYYVRLLSHLAKSWQMFVSIKFEALLHFCSFAFSNIGRFLHQHSTQLIMSHFELNQRVHLNNFVTISKLHFTEHISFCLSCAFYSCFSFDCYEDKVPFVTNVFYYFSNINFSLTPSQSSSYLSTSNVQAFNKQTNLYLFSLFL